MALYIYHMQQLLFGNSVSYRKFYNEEVLRFLKKREKSCFLMIVIYRDPASLLCRPLPIKNPSRSPWMASCSSSNRDAQRTCRCKTFRASPVTASKREKIQMVQESSFSCPLVSHTAFNALHMDKANGLDEQ